MPRWGLLLWPAGVALGLLAERAGFGWDDPGHWLPDLAVGWTFLACGLVAWSRRPESHTGLLMVATGMTWFLGNFDSHLLYLHRGPLVHCVLSYPDGRLTSRPEQAATVLGYAAAVAWPVGESELATIVFAVLVVAVAVQGYLAAVGRDRRARVPGVQAAITFGAVTELAATARLAFPAGDANELALVAYEVVLCAIAIGFLLGLFRAPWERPAVTDLVVELGEARSPTLRDALARVLGDPSLEVGYWVAESGSYVDAQGRALALPGPGSRRSLTPIERDGQPLAALVHDPAVLDDPSLVASVAAAARLAASHARLQAQVRVQVAELQASRRRLVAAGDQERERLEERLREGAERRLLELAEELGHVRALAKDGSGALERIAEAERQLERTLDDLRELARGLHPRRLAEAGLPGALTALAEQSTVPVQVNVVPEMRLSQAVEAAAYFVCSEALANVAKYAAATRVSVAVVNRDGRLMIEVTDDGVGGADPTRGSGLRGLRDRIEALGGMLRIESPTGGGTRVAAELPLGQLGSGKGVRD
jgi:signal transduction histidine kinase